MAAFDNPKDNRNDVDSNEVFARPPNGEEVVISGMSGVFPSSDSVIEFMENLYSGVDMVTSDDPKFSSNDPEIPKHLGRIKGLEKFDSQFFKVSYQLGTVLEPMARKLLEHAYAAIFDSGTSPLALKKKKIGVFIGASFADTSSLFFYEIKKRNDFIVSGSSKAMLANRISYWIDGKGPSYQLDCACASSTACLEQAYKSMNAGECDAAIVGGCNYCEHPNLSLNLRRAGLLCLDGKTKCFDKNGDGYVRANAVSLLFLQKAKDAKRIYAEVYHAKGKYNLKPDAQFLPLWKSEDIQTFLNEFYVESNINPGDVEYVEGHGAGIAEADENEIKAISEIFAKNKPVKVGCVKSNMGHGDAASGLCAVTKVCLAYHKGEIPANLHYIDPQNHIPAVRDGRIQVVTERTQFDRGFTALNNFSFTGANYHVLLKGHYRKKDPKRYTSKIPYIVLVSGRDEMCVKNILDDLKSQPVDPEKIGLLHSLFEFDISGHTGRGYTILDTNEKKETMTFSESVDIYPGVKRPLWFVYSGMGSQWAGMGTDLMRIPTFAAAIEKCHKVLEPKGIDIVKILTKPHETLLEDLLNCFVGIGAVQIGLTNILKEMGIVPDYIIGHSLGELACAYHDETLTVEEMMLSTYSRGKVCYESHFIRGSMAAVAMGYKVLVKQCPPEIDIACHNSSESCTISGPSEIMKDFVNELSKRGVFTREIPSANIAFHSRYVASAGPELLSRLQKIIKHPKPRSKKWLSTSVPQENWNDPIAKYSSAEYQTNNLLSPVFFEEVSKMIPDNAVVVEIAPHGLLQAILKRSHKQCTHISLTKRGTADGVKFLLEAIGKLYETGFNPKVDVLYPKIEFPVSTETSVLSHLVKWEHSENWPITTFYEVDKIVASARNIVISIHDDEYKYFEGHVRNGNKVLPEAALLVYVWETLAMYKGMKYQELSVNFRDIQFHSEIIMTQGEPVRLTISINKGNDQFEVSQDKMTILSGIINGNTIIKFHHKIEEFQPEEDEILLNSDDVYKLLDSRGFSYKGEFKSLHLTNLERNKAYVRWNNEWILLIDSLIQLCTLARHHDGISKPKFIRKLRVSVAEHKIASKIMFKDKSFFSAQYCETYGVVRCAGVELDNITFHDEPITEQEPDVLLKQSFFPFFSTEEIDLKTALQINLQVIAENLRTNNIKITQFAKSTDLFKDIENITNTIPSININLHALHVNYEKIEFTNGQDYQSNVFLVENLLGDEKKIQFINEVISKDAFVMTLEDAVPKMQSFIKKYFNIITCMSDGKQILVLLKQANYSPSVTFIPITYDNRFSWVPNVYSELQKTKRVVLVSERQPYCGLIRFVKKLKCDGFHKANAIIIDDFNAQAFNPDSDIYRDQIQKNLTVNVLRKGQWGGYYYYTQYNRCAMTKNVTLINSVPGDLEKLSWIETPVFPASNNLVQVYYTGLSIRDCQIVVGPKTKDKSLGMDYSGIDINGDRVMGIVSGGATASTVEADLDLLWPVPEHWNLEDAATVPLPYVHAYYCLLLKCRLLNGYKVFVTGGAGALGQAVIAICLASDCTVFTTVSDLEKKKFLIRLFPNLDEKNIGYSHDEFFYSSVISNSKRERCNIVINCAIGSLREGVLKCVGENGIFLDINTHEMYKNNKFGMFFLNDDKCYKTVNLASIFKPENINDKKILQGAICEGIRKGVVKPLSRVAYGYTHITKAFRLLSLSKHRGRVLIRMKDPITTTKGFNVIPRLTFTNQDAYIIMCDENGLGFNLADKFVSRGVRKIILHLRSKPVTGYLQAKIALWMKQGVSIKLSFENLQKEHECLKIFKDGMKFGAIKGIVFIQDFEANDDDKQDFIDIFNKISLAVINLDRISRNYFQLSQFIIISRISQSASGAYALSISEKVCELRNESGFPALLLQCELLEEFDSDQPEANVKPQKVSALFNAMERSLKFKLNNVMTFNMESINTTDILKKISKTLGLNDIQQFDGSSTIRDLKLNDVNLEELRAIFRNTYHIDYSTEYLQSMPLHRPIQMNKHLIKERTSFDCGFRALYAQVDDEEDTVASHPLVLMDNALNNDAEIDLDPNETYLIMIPGLEGRHQIFTTMAEKMKLQTVTVPLGPDMTYASIPEIAISVRKLVRSKLKTKSKFYLLGYSFGVNVALELALLLEKEGHVGIVFCVDSSPDALKIQIDAYLGNATQEQLPNDIIKHVFTIITGKNGEELNEDLEKTENWSDKVEVCVKRLTKYVRYSHQYKRNVLNSAYRRIVMSQEYEPQFVLKSELILIKGTPHPKAKSLSDDYNLSKYTKQPVRVFEIESDHVLAPKDLNLSNIVNRLLEPRLLEAFKNRNLCHVYTLTN